MDRKKIFWAIASVFIAILSIWTVVSQSKHFSFEILMSFIINANKGWLFMSFVCTFYNIPKEIDIEFLRYPISRTLTIRNPLS